MTTIQNNDIQSINAALLRAVKNSENVNVNNIQNVTQVNKTTEVVKLSDGTSLDIGSLRRSITALTSANEALLNKLNKQDSELKTLKDQIQNIGFTTDNQGKTLVFSNYLGIDEESEVPVIIAQYSSNGLAWHNEFISGQDIYIRFSYDAGDSWTDPIKIVGEDGSAYAYYGLVSSSVDMPADLEGNFFLCGENYTGPAEFLVNGLQLLVNDKVLVVNKTYLKGFIYMYNGNSWEAVTDKNNYRYVIAMNDLISIGEPVSPGLLQQFQSSIAVYTPRYLGGFAVAPVTHNNGDTFCFTGTTTGQFTKGMCYKWSDSSGWSLLSMTAPENAEVYMKALNDILANTSEVGTFAALFAQHITANSAFIKNLAAQIITLQSGGTIESTNFSTSDTGFQIKANGDAVFNKGNFNGITATGGSFTDITANNGTYNNIIANKAQLQNTLLKLSTNLVITVNQTSINSMWENAQKIINLFKNTFNVFDDRNQFVGIVNGALNFDFSGTMANNSLLSIELTNSSCLQVNVSDVKVEITVQNVIGIRNDRNKPELFEISILILSNSWHIWIMSDNTIINLPGDYEDHSLKEFNTRLAFYF